MFIDKLVYLQAWRVTKVIHSMKTYTSVLSLVILLIVFSGCKSTHETTSRENNRPAPAQVQLWQEKQKEMQDKGERSGLILDEINQLNTYAEEKAKLVCQMKTLEKSAEQAYSEVEAAEVKQQVIALDTQITQLSLEIEEYCSNEMRQKYFYQIYKQHAAQCP